MKHLLTVLLTIGATLALPNYLNNDEFSTGNNLFGVDVLNELLEDGDGNVLVSPFSAEVILALLQSGANGETGEELRSALHLPNTAEEADNLFKNVLPTINSKYVTVETANKVYIEEGFSIKESFEETVENTYQAGLQNIEFKEPEEAADEINEWVKEHTNDKIEKIVTPDSLKEQTQLLLVNALYFKGNWSHPFDSSFSGTSEFYTTAEAPLDATFMSLSESLNYYESDELDAKILELPFEGYEATFTIVLPNELDGIGLLEKQLNTVFTTPNYSKEKVGVKLPKFKFESTIKFKDILVKLGVEKIFEDSADLSGIADAGLKVSAVTQKTFIAVQEGGVEAAAITAVPVGPTVVLPETKHFIADHPFIFYIKFQDIVLFAGRVTVPQFEDDN